MEEGERTGAGWTRCAPFVRSLPGTAVLRPPDLPRGAQKARHRRHTDLRGAQRTQLRGRRGRGRGLGSPSLPVPGPPASRAKGRAYWPAWLRAPRPLAGLGEEHAATVAGAQSGGGGPADGPWARRAGGAQRAWRAWGCGRPLGAGCRAQATAGREPPRPRPPAPAAAPRAPAPTAPALRARRPPWPPLAAPSSARTCGLVTKICGGWCTVGEPERDGAGGGCPGGCGRARGHRPRAVGVPLFVGSAAVGLAGTPRAGRLSGRGSIGSSREPPRTPRRLKRTSWRFVRRLRVQELAAPEATAEWRAPALFPRGPACREAAAETPPTPCSRGGRGWGGSSWDKASRRRWPELAPRDWPTSASADETSRPPEIPPWRPGALRPGGEGGMRPNGSSPEGLPRPRPECALSLLWPPLSLCKMG